MSKLPSYENYFGKNDHVKELTSKDFDNIVTYKLNKDRKLSGCCVILFYAPWCGHCKAVKDTWKKLAELATFYDVYAYNCENNKIHLQKIQKELPQLIKGYPTILLYKKGEPVEEYRGDRNLKDLTLLCMRACKNE